MKARLDTFEDDRPDNIDIKIDKIAARSPWLACHRLFSFECTFIAPCVILEKGEPLDEWVSRVAPDVTTSMTIMSHVVKVVIDLHQAGLVHRDLKPSNTIWLDSRKGFTVIDFGSAAVEGECLTTSEYFIRPINISLNVLEKQ